MTLRVERALRRLTVSTLGVSAIACTLSPLSGCSATERDRYFSSRSVIIPAQAGDGSTTLASWPYGQSSQPSASARAGSMSDLPE